MKKLPRIVRQLQLNAASEDLLEALMLAAYEVNSLETHKVVEAAICKATDPAIGEKIWRRVRARKGRRR